MSDQRLNFVPNDGYTEPGYLAEVPGKSNAMRFTFRPLLAEEKRALLETMEKMKGGQEAVKVSEVLSDQVKSWDLADAKGAAVPINVTIMRRVKPSVLWALWGIVSGNDASDIDPQWDDSQKEKSALENAVALTKPEPYGESREGSDEKNSSGA